MIIRILQIYIGLNVRQQSLRPCLARVLRPQHRGRLVQLPILPSLPVRVDLLEVLRLPGLIAIGPLDLRATGSCRLARAGRVQLGVKSFHAGGDGLEDTRDLLRFEITVHHRRPREDGEFVDQQGEGGGGFVAEELRFQPV